MNVARWTSSLFAWKRVREDRDWSYFENAVTGQRQGRWRGGRYTLVDYQFVRPGDIIDGPFGREILTDRYDLDSHPRSGGA
jgi:hypothetical protein